MKTKIAFVVNEFNSLFNFRKELVLKLLELNHDITIIGPKSGNYQFFQEKGCRILFIDLSRKSKSIFKDLKYYRQLKKYLKKAKASYVFSYSLKPNMYTGLLCNRYGFIHIATITGLGMAFDMNKFFVSILVKLLRKAFKHSKIIYCQNSYIYDYFKAKKIAADRLKVINGSGINIEEFKFNDYPKELHDKIKLLYAGRVASIKGIEEMLEAFRHVGETYHNVHLFIAGKIDEPKYESLINNLGSDLVEYVGELNDVKDLIKKSSAVIVPSHSEGMSNILQESLASGRPVLATNIPGCKELCIDGKTGYSFLPNNSNDCQRAMQQFINITYEQKCEMGKFGRKYVEDNFDRKKITKEYLNNLSYEQQ